MREMGWVRGLIVALLVNGAFIIATPSLTLWPRIAVSVLLIVAMQLVAGARSSSEEAP